MLCLLLLILESKLELKKKKNFETSDGGSLEKYYSFVSRLIDITFPEMDTVYSLS